MVNGDTSRSVLKALFESHPERGVILGHRISRGWGDILNVEVFSGRELSSGLEMDAAAKSRVCTAVESALANQRHYVRVIEEADGIG